MNIHARFHLTEVRRAQGYYRDPETCTDPRDAKVVESAYVTLNAVQGEPFGAYTPSGKLEMLIVNPTASKVFFDAAIGQEFDLVFTPVTNEEKGEAR